MKERLPADSLKERLLKTLDPRFSAPALKTLKDKNMTRAAFYYGCKLEASTRVPKKCLDKSVFLIFAKARHDQLGKPLSQVHFSTGGKELMFGKAAGYYTLEPPASPTSMGSAHRYLAIVHKLSGLRADLVGEVTDEWTIAANRDEDKAILKKGIQTQSCLEYFRNKPAFEEKRGERTSESARIMVDELCPDGVPSTPVSLSMGPMTPSPARPASASPVVVDEPSAAAPPARPMPGASPRADEAE